MKPSNLTPDRWRLIDRVFEEALEREEVQRAAFLDEACGDDAELRRDVEKLLAASVVADAESGLPPRRLRAALLASSLADGHLEGTEIGPFRIIREVGRGGMGTVYLAEDTRLGRRVALKALPPYLGRGAASRERFVTEARAVSALDHRNIATLHEIDATEDGQLYMVFSYYEGETLAERIGRGPLDPQSAIDVARAVADGLGAAHERGIIHRDVKPSNILLTGDGAVKLLDFGVAKVAGEELTGDGGPVGTASYMSPEQASGGIVDRRSDLWSLGVTLYEMVTGKRPFEGAEATSTLRAIMQDDPVAPTTLIPELPDALEQILARLLCKDPGDRYASADELSVDLDASRDGSGLQARARKHSAPWASSRPRHAGHRSTVLRVGLLVAGVLVVALVGVLQWSGREGSAPRVDRLVVLPLVNATGDPGQQHVVDGVHEALVAELGELGIVDVISLGSAFGMDSSLSLSQIADSLRVDAVVEGTVRTQGERLTITVGLSTVRPERRLWSETYQGSLTDIGEVVGSIARAVGTATEIPIAPVAEARLTSEVVADERAYEAYLLARFNLSRNNAEGFALAERYLEEALRIDSTFALAYVDLAEIRGRAAFFGLRDPSEVLPGVSALIERAMSIDSTLALAYVRRAAVRLFWDRDVSAAEQDARRALQLNPSLAEAHYLLSEVLAVRGEFDDALELAVRGSDLSPWSEFSAVREALALYYMADFEGAIEGVREAIDFFPEFWQAHWILCISLGGAGRWQEAVGPCERAVELSRGASMASSALGWVRARGGNVEAAQDILGRLAEPPEGVYVAPTHVATVYAGLGDADQAFRWLDRAYRERDLGLVYLPEHVFFDTLRSDPRFTRLLQRMGISRPTPTSAVGGQ